MAAPCVSCELSLKSGERTNFKCDLATNDGNFSHQSVRDAISKVKVELNEFLTLQVEKDKQESAQLKKSGVRPNAKSGSAGTAGAGEADKAEAEGDVVTSVAGNGNDPDDMGMEDDEDDEDQDVPKEADCGDQTTGSKRDAKNWESTSSKKSKLSDS